MVAESAKKSSSASRAGGSESITTKSLLLLLRTCRDMRNTLVWARVRIWRAGMVRGRRQRLQLTHHHAPKQNASKCEHLLVHSNRWFAVGLVTLCGVGCVWVWVGAAGSSTATSSLDPCRHGWLCSSGRSCYASLAASSVASHNQKSGENVVTWLGMVHVETSGGRGEMAVGGRSVWTAYGVARYSILST